MKKVLVTILLSVVCVFASAQTMNNINVKGKADGPFYQNNGNVKVYGVVLNGQKSGTWTETHPNSDMPHYIIQFKDDKKDGLYLEFEKQGIIVNRMEFKNDLIDGVCCKYKNTNIMEYVSYKEGKKNGESKLFYERGMLMETSTYKDGRRDGVTIWYSNKDKEQGPMVAMYTYKDGRFDGPQETYYENGMLKSRKTFSDNRQEGPSYEFYEDGSLKSEANFKNGEQKGKKKEYPQGKKFLK